MKQKQWQPIPRNYSRARQAGTLIKCPLCGHVSPVYHFAWSACTCQGCRKMIEKTDYLILR